MVHVGLEHVVRHEHGLESRFSRVIWLKITNAHALRLISPRRGFDGVLLESVTVGDI